MKILITSILDGAEFLEIHANFARNIIVGFGRLGGQTSASSPTSLQCLPASLTSRLLKRRRFVRFCDASISRLSALRMSPVSCPAGAGARRHHPAWGKTALCLFRSNGAADNGHHPEGIRRRIRGHEFQTHRLRHEFCLACIRDRRAGAKRRSADHLPQGDRRGVRPGGDARAKTEEYRQTYANPFMAAKRDSSTTSSIRVIPDTG